MLKLRYKNRPFEGVHQNILQSALQFYNPICINILDSRERERKKEIERGRKRERIRKKSGEKERVRKKAGKRNKE